MLGAGASIDAGIPNWDELCTELLSSLTKKLMKEKDLTLDEKSSMLLNEKLKKENGNSPLLQIRYIRAGLKEEFEKSLQNILYANCTFNSPLLKEITKLANPPRNRKGLKSIINFNFDDLIEVNLNKLDINNKSIYRESDKEDTDALSIYHVHGYIPSKHSKKGDNELSPLVFSEEGYHKVFQEPYHWSNLVQLNHLKESTCLLIGLSMTDPNLRRILEIAAKKTNEQCHHYVILKREDLIDKSLPAAKAENIALKKFNLANYGIQEEVMKELGINILWIESYQEIPGIIKKIRKS